MHAAAAALIRGGIAGRRIRPGPGLLARIVIPLLLLRGELDQRVDAAEIEHEVKDGDVLPIGGGLRAIHVPGHCAGQFAFLWPHAGGVLFAADAVANMLGRLGASILYENLEQGMRDFHTLAALNFATTCFGHGRPIVGGASERFRQKWA
jgi:glyoxylase-like metal-dependent hydrolase (beta-lactamase superfamily II)